MSTYRSAVVPEGEEMLREWIGGTGSYYYDFVWQAVVDSRAFDGFRSHEHYRAILEHVTKELGSEYLKLIADPTVRQVCFDSEFADTIGNPEVHIYEDRKISPTTLRYGKVLLDLINYFPAFINYKSIVELGVGYGGQARLISEYCKKTKSMLTTYTLVDLLPVIHLARRYVEHFHMKFSCIYETKSTIKNEMSGTL
jgi:putative sugar O-methyltransferase